MKQLGNTSQWPCAEERDGGWGRRFLDTPIEAYCIKSQSIKKKD
jgi:hypothetical protein